jgi:hypothetical protein
MSQGDDLTIPIICPQCSEQFQKTLGRLKASDGFDCPSCHVHIRYEHETLIYDAQGGGRVRTIGTRFIVPSE